MSDVISQYALSLGILNTYLKWRLNPFLSLNKTGLFVGLFYLQSFTHASADDQQVYSLLQHLLQISRLYSWGMLGWEKQNNVWAPPSLLEGKTPQRAILTPAVSKLCVLCFNIQSCTCIHVCILWVLWFWFYSRRSQSLSSPRPDCLLARPYSPCSWRSIPSPSCGPRRARRSLERTCYVRLPAVRQERHTVKYCSSKA